MTHKPRISFEKEIIIPIPPIAVVAIGRLEA
jgi:hypothetical protein